MQFPTPAELKYNWSSLFHLKNSMWLILSSDCQDMITTVIFSHHYLVTVNCRHLYILICLWQHKHLQTGWRWRTEQKPPGVSWNCLVVAIECMLTVCGGKQGRKRNEDRQFRSWQKKMKQIFFSSIDSFVHGFAFNGPFSLANFIQGIFKNQASNCKIQGIHTFS